MPVIFYIWAMLEAGLTFGYIFLAIYLIGRWKIFRVPGISVKVFYGLFIIKVAAAFALYIIYTQFYTDRAYADIFRYYDDSAVIYQTLTEKPYDYFRMLTGIDGKAPELLNYYDSMRNWYNTDLIFNDSRTMIRLNAFLRLFTLGTYFPHAIVMCFLAMVGLTGIFRVMNNAVKGRAFLLMIIVYLLPSILLWTSGMIKEAFLVFALGTLLYQVSMLMNESALSWKRLFYVLLAVMILITVKAYVFFLMLPLIMSWMISKFVPGKAGWIWVPVYIIYFIALAAMAPALTGNTVPRLISDKQAEFYFVAGHEQAKSVVEVERIPPDWTGLLTAAPGAFFRTLLLPMPGHAHNILMWFSAAENIFILLLSFFLLFTMKMEFLKNLSVFVICCLLFGVSVFILSGWVTPIIGALVRYKVPGLPFLLLPLTAVSYRKWMSGYFISWFHDKTV